MTERSASVIGTTVIGRDIEALFFGPPTYAKSRPPAVVFGAIHGDEPLGVHCIMQLAHDLLERPPGRPTWLIPALNGDGLAAGTKNNANDVDLNRNFAATSWTAEHKAGYRPGERAESEPETRALADLIAEHNIERIIALHSPFRTVNWDGAAEALAMAMGELNGYGATRDIGYPTPGSLGSKYGVDAGLEVITLEIPMISEQQAWEQNRSALRFAIDLPT